VHLFAHERFALRDKLINLLKIVISVGLVAWAFSKIDLKQVGAQLATANPWLIVAALALFELAIVINGAKWQVLLRAQGVHVPFGAVLQFLFTGFFFNNFLPANVGGDVIRGYGLARYTDRGADAAVSVIVDRIVGLTAYMSTAFVAAVIIVNLSSDQGIQKLEWVAFVALLMLLAGFATLLSRRVRAVLSLSSPGAGCLASPHSGTAYPVHSMPTAFNTVRWRWLLAWAFWASAAPLPSTGFSRSLWGLMSLPTIFLLNPLIAGPHAADLHRRHRCQSGRLSVFLRTRRRPAEPCPGCFC
jgi:uncharacterized membrane protein YbhN (UPF0104 family)